MTTQEYIPADGSKRLYVNLCPSCSFVHHTETEHLDLCQACGHSSESPLTLKKVGAEWRPKSKLESMIDGHPVMAQAWMERLSTPSADLGETGVSFPVISGLSYKP